MAPSNRCVLGSVSTVSGKEKLKCLGKKNCSGATLFATKLTQMTLGFNCRN